MDGDGSGFRAAVPESTHCSGGCSQTEQGEVINEEKLALFATFVGCSFVCEVVVVVKRGSPSPS